MVRHVSKITKNVCNEINMVLTNCTEFDLNQIYFQNISLFYKYFLLVINKLSRAVNLRGIEYLFKNKFELELLI